MRKPEGYYKKKDKTGRMVTHPITPKKPRSTYKEPPMVLHKIEHPKPKSIWDKAIEEERKSKEEFEKKLAEQNLLREQEFEIRLLYDKCRSSDPVKASMARKELEEKYPLVYKHLREHFKGAEPTPQLVKEEKSASEKIRELFKKKPTEKKLELPTEEEAREKIEKEKEVWEKTKPSEEEEELTEEESETEEKEGSENERGS